MKHAAFIGIIAISILSSTSVYALTGKEIAEKAYEVSKANDEKIEDVSCKLTHVMTDGDGEEMVRVVGNLYQKDPDKEYFEILEYYKDGKKEEIPNEDDEEEGDELEIKFPFEEDYFDDYEYKYKRTETKIGKECYVVGIIGKKKSEGYIKGTSWIDKETFELVKVYAELYEQPEHVSESSMTMFFGSQGGYNVLKKVKMYAKATFLLFINKKINMTQEFSDYRFNTGLDDGLFK